MAARNLKQLAGVFGNKRALASFTVNPNGTGVPTISEDHDKCVASVARTAVGAIEVTLRDTWLGYSNIQVTVQLNAAAATLVVVTGAPTPTTTKKFLLTTMQESAGAFAAADIAANANNKLHVTLTLRDSNVPS